ncbi:MAG: YbaN family protein [Fuerstiella sp.]|nr:YbaN family protein [Fuerstiella sp.]
MNSPSSDRPTVTGWKKALFLVLAGLFFVLGVLGAILPGLPTTPFLLLTSFFLARSSPRVNAALLRSRFFGPILTDWQEHRGVRKDVKIQAIVCVVFAVTAAVYFSPSSLTIRLPVILLGSIGVAVIVRLPSTPQS